MTPDAPEYGPSGYVPPRAAKRARKIVLRAPMGLGWPLAAVVAGLVVALTGFGFYATRARAPGAPYRPVRAVEQVAAAGGAGIVALPPLAHGLLVVGAGGGLRTFEAPAVPVSYCAPSQRLEAADGTVYNLNGRAVGGPGESLRPVPGQLFDGQLYADPRPLPAAPRSDDGEQPACESAARPPTTIPQ